MDWPTAVNACDGPQIKKGALRLTRRENGAIRELGKLDGGL